MASVVGIDLGTSSCSVAAIIDGKPQVLPVFAGHDEMPTYVAFTPTGERLVGWAAKRQVVTNPSDTIFTIKRLIGRRFSSAATQAELGLLPYKVFPSATGGLWVEAQGRSYSPTEITAIMLTEVRRAASEYLGFDVKQAVITVPAYFDKSQRQATNQAAVIAGLEPLRLIAEPTAAALACGFGRDPKLRTVAVYDLGGGTFDISILDIGDNVFEVKAINGDNRLGGEDFDHTLVKYFIAEIKGERGIDVSQDHLALHRLKEVAERFKIYLDTTRTVEETLPYLTVIKGQPFHVNLKLSRSVLEQLFNQLIERTLEPCRQAVADADQRPDALILVGGMSRMPLVQKRVSEFFGLTPVRHHDACRVVAQGAAIHAGVLSGDIKEVLLLDVVPLSVGFSDPAGAYAEVIHKNTTLPTRRSFNYSIDERSGKCLRRQRTLHHTRDGQDRWEIDTKGTRIDLDLGGLMQSRIIKIVEGVGVTDVKGAIFGEVEVEFGLTTSRAERSLNVTFDLDPDATLTATFEEESTEQKFTKKVEARNPFERAARADSELSTGYSDNDMASARAQGDELLTLVDASLKAVGDDIDPTILSKIIESRDSLQRAMQSRDPMELSGALAAVCKVANIELPEKRTSIGKDARAVEVSAAARGRSIFISYARKDLEWLERIRVHLAQLERLGHVDIWHDGKIATGLPWQAEIDRALKKATAAVLLVSANFMASSFIYDYELPPILERNRVIGLRIFPIFVGHCYFKRDPVLSRLNAFNDPTLPLTAMSNAEVEASLARLVEELWRCLDNSD
jgi:molecular chaperone DnaK